MHYRLDTQFFLDTLLALEQGLAAARAAREGDAPAKRVTAGRVICRQADRFAESLDEWRADDPSHDLPH